MQKTADAFFITITLGKDDISRNDYYEQGKMYFELHQYKGHDTSYNYNNTMISSLLTPIGFNIAEVHIEPLGTTYTIWLTRITQVLSSHRLGVLSSFCPHFWPCSSWRFCGYWFSSYDPYFPWIWCLFQCIWGLFKGVVCATNTKIRIKQLQHWRSKIRIKEYGSKVKIRKMQLQIVDPNK